MSKDSQVLIDRRVIELYCNGTEQDRETITKLYGSLFHDIGMRMFGQAVAGFVQSNNEKMSYPFVFNGKEYVLKMSYEEKK